MIKYYNWLLVLGLIWFITAGGCNVNSPQTETANVTTDLSALQAVNLAADERLQIVTTNNIIADIVQNVGGDLLEVHILLPPQVDPHGFQPTPQDLTRVTQSHLVFANGLGLEDFLTDMVKNVGDEVTIVELSVGIETRHLETDEVHTDHATEDEADHAETLSDIDPHVWTSPVNMIILAQNVERALATLDPAHAEIYATNAAATIAQLTELDAWVQTEIAKIPPENRNLVTDHVVWGYYAHRYGLKQIGAVIPGFSTNAEPSAQDIAILQDAIKTYNVKAIFVGHTVNGTMAQRIAEDMSLQLVYLYTESLGEPGSEAATYLDYIRYNTEAIVTALQ